jgi:DNA invertase Pin-like site-specific DNA recombinase
MGKLVTYIRVSTLRQGVSGLGLDAQKHAVETFARSSGHAIVAEVREIESGKRCDRPQLGHALALCRLHNATCASPSSIVSLVTWLSCRRS